MSFTFCKVIIKPGNPSMQPFVRYEGGLLDEFDVYDRMRRDSDYAKVAFTGDIWERIRVEHYRFFSGEAKERPADGDHFAMMQAYDKLAAQHGAGPFMDREEIQWFRDVSYSYSVYRSSCHFSTTIHQRITKHQPRSRQLAGAFFMESIRQTGANGGRNGAAVQG